MFVEDTLDWPVRIKIERPAKLITLETCTDAADQFDNVPEAMEWVNTANAQIGVVQFHVANGRISGRHWMSYVDGLRVRQFIQMLRRFSAGFRDGIMIKPKR